MSPTPTEEELLEQAKSVQSNAYKVEDLKEVLDEDPHEVDEDAL